MNDIFKIINELKMTTNILYCLDSRDDQLTRHQTLKTIEIYIQNLEEFIREKLLFGYSEPNEEENERHGYDLKHKTEVELKLTEVINKQIKKESLMDSIFSKMRDKI